MTKTELVDVVAAKTTQSKKATAAAIDAMIEAITETLEKGEKLTLIGFGTFEVRQRAARNGHNPQDPKKKISIPAKKVPVFSAGKALKEKVEDR